MSYLNDLCFERLNIIITFAFNLNSCVTLITERKWTKIQNIPLFVVYKSLQPFALWIFPIYSLFDCYL